ncbi:hypothetical protein ACI2KS_10785 [Pseudomonas sp. NPDC087358]|uniref:hypothetical protein n=1 Tax=Pseudomonas sp. NPDC087358 TaxID=3364439 RepID=UPI00384B3598
MARQVINLGEIPSGTGGDTNRSANVKCNENFTELYEKMAEKGANNDITSLSGLTTALSVAQGGTGVSSMANLLAALNAVGNYSRANIVGTVSDVGGIPNGAILESGILNGCYYEKRADGSLTQRKQVTIGGGTAASGNIFKSLNQDMGAFAYQFVGDYEMFGYGISESAGGGWAGQQLFGSALAWGTWACYHQLAAGGNMIIALVAHGRWKA